MKPDYNQMMKQVQKMQKEMQKAQDELAQEKIEATSGGGAVKVVISGQLQVEEIVIDPNAVEDVDLLQDMVQAAVNEAISQAQDLASQKLGRLTGGLEIPGLM